MTDIVSVPTGNFTPGPAPRWSSGGALINAAWNQANAKFDLFEYKMGLVTNSGGTGWLDDAAVPGSGVVGGLHQPCVDQLHIGHVGIRGGERSDAGLTTSTSAASGFEAAT